MDMFHSTLKLSVETLENPFIAPASLEYIQLFMKIIGYQGDVDKVSAFFTKNLAQSWQTMFKDYHSIKDNIPLVSVSTTGNVTVRGMQTLDEFITDDIRVTEEYKEYEKKKKRKQVSGETSLLKKSLKVTIQQVKQSTTPIPPPSDDKEMDKIAKAILLSLTMHKTAIIVEVQENVAKVQEKILEEDIAKMVDGKNEESYSSEFAYSIFQDDDDDSSNRIEPRSHKKNPKTVDVDDENEKEKKDDKKDDDNDDDNNDDHTDHTLVKAQMAGSLETRNKKMQTLIPSPPRSPRTNLSSDKSLSQELTDTVSPSPATTSQDQSKTKRISNKYRHLPGALHRMGRVVVDTIIQERDAFQDEVPALISKEFVNHAPKIIEELFKNHMKNNVI
ncbi:hypothetical protein Tco_0793565 [Tanacetum coccineum]